MFYCSCGYIFSAAQVEAALTSAALLRQRLMLHIASMKSMQMAIDQKADESLISWLGNVSFEAGKRLGYVLGSLRSWFD